MRFVYEGVFVSPHSFVFLLRTLLFVAAVVAALCSCEIRHLYWTLGFLELGDSSSSVVISLV